MDGGNGGFDNGYRDGWSGGPPKGNDPGYISGYTSGNDDADLASHGGRSGRHSGGNGFNIIDAIIGFVMALLFLANIAGDNEGLFSDAGFLIVLIILWIINMLVIYVYKYWITHR